MSANLQLKGYLDIAYRRRWWILVPLVLCVAASALVLNRLPKTYRASTTILVTPQRLPEDFVRPTVTTRVEDRMASMEVQILGRSFLETVAREAGLLDPEADEAEIASACAKLGTQVELTAGSNLSYFEVAVEDAVPERAAQIANRLAGLFIEQNSRLRSEQATGTRSTVEGWLEKKKAQLDSMESKIAAYKRGHLWELSEQLNANLRLLDTAQTQLAGINKDIQAREDRITLLRERAAAQGATAADDGADADPAARRLATLESELAQLRVSYTEENPAVKKKLYEIAEFKRQHPEIGRRRPEPGPSPVSSARGEIARVEREIEAMQQERARVQSQIASLTVKINNTPLREQELAALTRDYGILRKEYDDLLSKREQATRAEEMEASRKSEQFRVQDEARVPTVPHRPKPLQVVLICALAGLGLGVGAAFVLEFLDQSVRSEDDFRAAFPDLPLLSAIPHLDPDAGHAARRASRGRHAAMLLAGIALALASRIALGL